MEITKQGIIQNRCNPRHKRACIHPNTIERSFLAQVHPAKLHNGKRTEGLLATQMKSSAVKCARRRELVRESWSRVGEASSLVVCLASLPHTSAPSRLAAETAAEAGLDPACGTPVALSSASEALAGQAADDDVKDGNYGSRVSLARRWQHVAWDATYRCRSRWP